MTHAAKPACTKERGDSAHSEEAVDEASKPGAGGAAAGIGAGTGAL